MKKKLKILGAFLGIEAPFCIDRELNMKYNMCRIKYLKFLIHGGKGIAWLEKSLKTN